MRAWFLGSIVFILMATFVAFHALLDLKNGFPGRIGGGLVASCMAMASMFACTRAESTAAFSDAKVGFVRAVFSIFVSTHATTRMLSMAEFTANVPVAGHAAKRPVRSCKCQSRRAGGRYLEKIPSLVFA